MKCTLKWMLPVAAVIGLAGCASKPPVVAVNTPTYAAAAQNPFIASSRAAIDMLVRDMEIPQQEQAPVLVATIVNVNDLTRTAALGRTLSEIYASHLASKHFNVKEMKLRGNVYIKEGTGELLLSREIRDIALNHNASLVLVGTYSQASHYTYVSLKLVRVADGRIVRSHDYALPNDRDVHRMLGVTSQH